MPGIWRALQCLRRYYDTRNAFPHLVNCGKYSFTILFYMSLSLYRIDESYTLKALFITCATINSIYCCKLFTVDTEISWPDFYSCVGPGDGLEYAKAIPFYGKQLLTVSGLCNPYAEHPFLRDVLGYKRPWVYYLAMILDPILRFNWIFYAIYAAELQHSALLSFFIGFSEVCRRGMWTLFRVENEHCTNVGRFRASRDVPLPYEIEPPTPSTPEEPDSHEENPPAVQDHLPSRGTWRNSPQTFDGGDASTTSNLEAQPPSGSLRRRGTITGTPMQRGLQRVGTIMGQAHAQDFERKRRPVAPEPASPYQGARTADESSDDEDEEGDVGVDAGEEGEAEAEEREIDEQDVQGAQEILSRHRSATNQ